MSDSQLFGGTPYGQVGPQPTAEAPTAKTPEQLAAELGPFDPPKDFDHGEEFRDGPPRSIPRYLRRGSFCRRRRGTAIVWAALGAVFVIISPWNIIRKLSFYVLPLAYIGYVGYGMIAISILVAMRNWLSRQNFEYVKSGIPFVGRVLALDLFLTKTVNNEKQEVIEAQSYVVVEYDNPETQVHEFGAVVSDEKWNLSASQKYATDLQVGDYVTLVAMPGRINESIKLYGFLGLDPNREYLTYKGKPLTGTSPIMAIMIATIVFCVMWLFVGLLYLINCCFPSEWSWSLGLTSMAIGGGIGAILGWLLGKSQPEDGTQTSPGVAAFLVGFLGCIAGIMGMGLINAAFDQSPPHYVPITINNHWQTTHNFVLRHYEIEFTEFNKGESEKSGVSIEDLGRLRAAKLAAKEVRQGALGLEWVPGFHPCMWVELPENADDKDKARAIPIDSQKWIALQFKQMGFDMNLAKLVTFDDEMDGDKEVKMIPVLLLPDGKQAPIPDEMYDRAKQQIQLLVNSLPNS